MTIPPRARGWLLGYLLRRTSRRPADFIIGGPGDEYLKRWFIIPRNPICNLYLHCFLRSDDDRALHDHPWASISVILRGSYVEVLRSGARWRREGCVTARGARTPHRVRLTEPLPWRANAPREVAAPVWTLFITGPRVRAWGFHCPNGWRRWQDFVADTPDGNTVGRGCD